MSRFSLEGYDGNQFDVDQCVHDAKTSIDPNILTALSKHWHLEVSEALASNSHTPKEILKELALLGDSMGWILMQNPSFEVEKTNTPTGLMTPARMRMAKSHQTSREVLEYLWQNDPNRFVRDEARINLGIGLTPR